MRSALLLSVWTILTLALPGALRADESVWMSDFDKARDIAAQTGKPLLVHFYAEWCGPCKQMDAKVLYQPSVKQEIQQRVVAVKLDVDQNPKLAKRFGVEKLPTDIIVEPSGSGTQLLESQGFHPMEEYRREIIVRGANRYAEVLAQRQQKANQDALAKATRDSSNNSNKMTAEDRLMLGGYCPVTLWKNRRWVKGNSELKFEHRGQVYYLADEEVLKEFKDNPERYAPRYMGCDPIMVVETDRAIKGDTRFAAFYDDELYIFTNEDNRKKFKTSPDKYARTRVVFDVLDIEFVTR